MAESLIIQLRAGESPRWMVCNDDGHVVVTASGLFASQLFAGWLFVPPGLFSPLSGASELSLLNPVGAYV